MTEGLWQDPEQAKEQDFQNLIEQAHKNGAQLEREHVQVLSDLSAEQVRRWKDVWIRLPVGTRRRIVALCDRLLEDDPRLSFFEVGRIALEDEDAEVREYGLRLIGIEEPFALGPRLGPGADGGELCCPARTGGVPGVRLLPG